jgi:hypothetical protein
MAFQNRQHVDDLITVDARLIEAKIISRIVHLKNVHQVAPITIAGYLAAIMFFYAMNDITYKRKISKYLPSGEERMRIRSRIKNQNTYINQSSSSAKDSISSSSLATISSSSSSSTRSSSSMSSSFLHTSFPNQN